MLATLDVGIHLMFVLIVLILFGSVVISNRRNK